MVHLTQAIGQFFAIMLGAILHAVGAIILWVLVGVLAITIAFAGLRWWRRTRL